MWLLSRYQDCVAALKDSRLGREASNVYTDEQMAAFRQAPENQQPLFDMTRNWMLFRDAPTHTRLRMLVHKAFTPRTVERMRENIQQIVNDLLDAVQPKGQMDIVRDLAYPLPVAVIAQLVGIPKADQVVFEKWAHDLAFTLELTQEAEVYNQGAAATVEFSAYLRNLIARRRKDPLDDLLTALIAAEETGDKLTEPELIATVILLLLAGHETTVKLIGNGVLALLRSPDQLAKLKADPSLARNAVEEILRYDSPVQFTSRLVLADGVEFGGQAIPRGVEVGLMLGAANRDPQQFPNPETFDITRAGADKHIGFGNGIHFCLGAPLARVEGEIALNVLFQRLPTLALGSEPPQYLPTYVLRGLDSLPTVL